MKIVLAADGSTFTKKALAFLVTHAEFANGDGEVVVLHVQPAVPPRVKTMVAPPPSTSTTARKPRRCSSRSRNSSRATR